MTSIACETQQRAERRVENETFTPRASPLITEDFTDVSNQNTRRPGEKGGQRYLFCLPKKDRRRRNPYPLVRQWSDAGPADQPSLITKSRWVRQNASLNKLRMSSSRENI